MDMNYFKILQEIKKIKASLALMVGNDAEFIKDVKLLYKKISTIYSDTQEEHDFLESKNDFIKFIERDEIMAHKGKILILDNLKVNFRERIDGMMSNGISLP